MDAKELMMGDWVLLNGEPKQVMETLFDSITIDCYPIEEEYIEPIPLTPEILEKNGFTTHVSHCGVKWLWIENQKFELAIDEENGSKITTALGLIDIEIKYVHELQHALKLCRIEKTIEL